VATTSLDVSIRRIDWELAGIFRIAYKSSTKIPTAVVELNDGEHRGRGEGIGVSYHGENIDSILKQLESIRDELRLGSDRSTLQGLLPPAGARNAADCALWDLEAKRRGCRAWALAGISKVDTLTTAYTLSLDEPQVMARAAAAAGRFSVLKLKLGGDGDVERVAAVRAQRPDTALIVDANQAWTEKHLRDYTPKLAALGVSLIEQPLPVGKDELLEHYQSPVPLCADESCQTADSLKEIASRYQYANIKLDKTGGLTEALKLARVASETGLKLMIGCMCGSSLSMAPAFIIGQLSTVVDLDGPLLAKSDWPDGIQYTGSEMGIPPSSLWG